eukprot:11201356-Lingulodinium_polyedra.AAC.1
MAAAAGADGAHGALVQLRDRARKTARPDAIKETYHLPHGEFLSGAQHLATQVRALSAGAAKIALNNWAV